jgi:hypothetical protein
VSWVSPWLAVWAAAVAIPALLILYFLKLRRRDVEISTTLLWKKAIQDFQANAPFQRLRKNILLLLQLLALAAALTALGQPQVRGVSLTGERHVILIDRSASMSSVDGRDGSGRAASRLDAAKEEALRLIESLREPGLFSKEGGDQAMVIAFDTSAKALQTFTNDKSLLRAAVNAITPSDGPTAIDEAIKLVLAQAPREVVIETKDDGTESRYERPPRPVGTIHLFTDGRLPDAEKVNPGPENPLIYHPAGSPASHNVGITAMRAGRAFDDPNRLSIFISIENTATRARTVDVECRIDDSLIGIKPVELPAASTDGPAPTAPGGTAPALARPAPSPGGTVFTIDRPQGGIVTVRVTPPEGDALATDNQAWLIVPPARRAAVAIVTTDNLFLRDALEQLPLARLDVLSPQRYEAERAAAKPVEYDVVILDGYLPQVPRDSPSPLPPGRFLIFGAVPQGELGLIDKGKGGASVLLDWSRDHPALRGLSLDPLFIAESRIVEVPRGAAAVALATSDSGPAILELTTPEARALVIPFDVVRSNWPFDISFVVFMAQAVGFLGEDELALGQLVQPGGVLSDRVPVGSKDVRVRGPGGEVTALGDPAPDGRIVFGPVQRSGVYLVSWSGRPGPTDAVDGRDGGRAVRAFAANLLSAAESDIGTSEKLSFATGDASATKLTQARSVRRLWPWLLLGALGIVLLEWWVYNRKVQL